MNGSGAAPGSPGDRAGAAAFSNASNVPRKAPSEPLLDVHIESGAIPPHAGNIAHDYKYNHQRINRDDSSSEKK
jgi:hypothetical protein